MSGPKVDWAARCGPLRQAMADPELTGMERRVFVIMWTFTGPDGDGARPGVDLLTEMLGAHVRSVRNALQGLIGRGYLVVTEKPNRRGGKATTYSVRVPADEAISASPSRAKDESFSAPSETLYRAENDTFSAPQSRALMLKKEEESARSGAPPPTALTRGDGAPSQGSGSGSGDGLPLNHDDVRHLETWSEWAATSDISVDRPVCKEHPRRRPWQALQRLRPGSRKRQKMGRGTQRLARRTERAALRHLSLPVLRRTWTNHHHRRPVLVRPPNPAARLDPDRTRALRRMPGLGPQHHPRKMGRHPQQLGRLQSR